ncbi:chemoreceptor glutamine deamidase CheD [Beggiatoa alba]|nr:chemoreceptor glutamine deamidase CheD [Beggiatoa alba]
MTGLLKKSRQSRSECLPGFEHINRYWDRVHEIDTAKILPGEFYVTRENELVTTVLGSCVSACIRDIKRGVGGMNHFMLPAAKGLVDLSINSNSARYGNHAMEMLINVILKMGGLKKNLEVKLFGGGRVITSMSSLDVGEQNISFIQNYTEVEKLNVASEDLGDIFPRKILYFPRTGRVLVKKLRKLHNDTLEKRERLYQEQLSHKTVGSNDIELF